jgi:catechol 2,3-dioxygenase-like lactoylglutathione lyase family enzyme
MLDLVFHHFGLAVKTPDQATSFLTALGYKLGEAVFDSGQNVHLMMATHPSQPQVEVIYAGREGGPIDKLVQQHPSGIVYHLCYSTKDLAQSLAQMKTAGLQVICFSKPKPAPLFQGQHVSFYHVTGMGLIEILEAR